MRPRILFNSGVLLSGIILLSACASHPEAPERNPTPETTKIAAQGIPVSQWGFDQEDSTEYLQAAFDSGEPIIVIPAEPGPWISRPLTLPSDKILIFEEGAELVAKRGDFLGRGDSLLNGNGVSNLLISGYGAVLRMWKSDYQNAPYEPAEWRNSIKLTGSENVRIEGLRILSSGGDGVYLGSQWSSDIPHNRNIELIDLELADHHRQGISIISVDGLVIRGCTIYGTVGTPPAAGIDFEPNRNYELLRNILVEDCRIYQNAGQGILIQLQKFDSTTEELDITIRDSYIRNNFYNLSLVGTRHDPRGVIRIENVRRGFLNLFLPGDNLILEK
jgi:hypothetical protein